MSVIAPINADDPGLVAFVALRRTRPYTGRNASRVQAFQPNRCAAARGAGCRSATNSTTQIDFNASITGNRDARMAGNKVPIKPTATAKTSPWITSLGVT
jgi:hypothetical protein